MTLKASQVFANDVPIQTVCLTRDVGGRSYRRTGNLTIQGSPDVVATNITVSEVTGTLRAEASNAANGPADITIGGFPTIGGNLVLSTGIGGSSVAVNASCCVAIILEFYDTGFLAATTLQSGELTCFLISSTSHAAGIAAINLSKLTLSGWDSNIGDNATFTLGDCWLTGALHIYGALEITANSLDVSGIDLSADASTTNLTVASGILTGFSSSGLWHPLSAGGTMNFSGPFISATVNALFASALASGANTGELNISGDAPTGQGLIDKAALISNGVSVNTN